MWSSVLAMWIRCVRNPDACFDVYDVFVNVWTWRAKPDFWIFWAFPSRYRKRTSFGTSCTKAGGWEVGLFWMAMFLIHLQLGVHQSNAAINAWEMLKGVNRKSRLYQNVMEQDTLQLKANVMSMNCIWQLQWNLGRTASCVVCFVQSVHAEVLLYNVANALSTSNTGRTST